MISKISIILSLVFCTAAAAEECEIEYLSDLEYTDIECQFYMGTEAYRNKFYSVAAEHWNNVTNSPIKYEGEENIKAMALSTVTFLTYQGLGVKQNRMKAVKNWKDAVSLGDLEARRHLGYAYSDDKFKNKDLVKALGWYESIFLLYPSPDEVNESDQDVYQDAKEGAEKLRTSLSKKQNNTAIIFAKSTL